MKDPSIEEHPTAGQAADPPGPPGLPDPPEPPGRPGLGQRLEEGRQTFQPGLWSRLVGIGVVAVYLLAFVVLNTGQVKVRFVVASTRVSLIWVILLSLGAGIVLGVLVSQLHRFRMRRRRAA